MSQSACQSVAEWGPMVRPGLSSETHSRTLVRWERIGSGHLVVDEVIHHPNTATPEEMEMEMEMEMEVDIRPPNTATLEEMALRPVDSGSVQTSRCQTSLNRTRRRWDPSQTKVRCVCRKKSVCLLGATPLRAGDGG
jgi:hypothetical protein